jgi:hypothetical protein
MSRRQRGNQRGDRIAKPLPPVAGKNRDSTGLDTDEDAGMRWGDEGLLYFSIPQQALAAGDFSQVHLLIQCY